jgi:6-pyruvoyltetrahydropterin/6-carboxytetrahydropterin synthase
VFKKPNEIARSLVHEISKTFTFEAAHYLPRVPPGHKCARPHGHSYSVEVHLRGDLDEHGWVRDFGEVKEHTAPIIATMDHRCLNEIDGLDNPTSEVIAQWIWHQLVDALPELSAVVVHETATTSSTFRG